VRRGIGYDEVDLEAATAKGIPVANLPDFCVDEVADHTMALILTSARQIILATTQTHAGRWDLKEFMPIPGLRSSTLGLVGFGKTARAVAVRAKSFGLEINATDPYVSVDVASKYGVNLMSLKQLLRSSDFISIHTPLDDDTRGMISKREFDLMKPSAIIVNTARGSVIDEKALIKALRNHRVAYAALDVVADESSTKDNPLCMMNNVILTPHMAWYSEDSARLAGVKTAEEIIRVFNGYLPRALVNFNVKKVRTDLKHDSVFLKESLRSQTQRNYRRTRTRRGQRKH